MTAHLSFASVLQARARDRPDDLGIRFLIDGEWQEWTWGEYWRGACIAAEVLRSSGVGPRENVLVLVPEVRPAVACLFGLWALGAVPVQVGIPPRLNDLERFVARLSETARRLDAKRAVIGESLAPIAGELDLGVEVIELGDESLRERPDPALPAVVEDPSAPAFLQLTSGSTAEPKAVVITHGIATAHLVSMSEALPSHSRSMGFSWLPLFHDMGLLGGLLFPFWNGFPTCIMSALDFKREPMLWIESASRFRVTIMAAPPSAYALVARHRRRLRDMTLDLSALECAMVGAEPVSADALRSFADTFADLGFRPSAFFPVYGLAEATVAATFPRLLEPTRVDRVSRSVLEREHQARPADSDSDALDIVGVGSAIPGSEIRITDDQDEELAERHIGEIQLRSETLMAGYYKDASATSGAIKDDWLRTGDLGYVADGELFVTDRKKELIIKGGHNISPQRIEDVVSKVEGVRPGCVVAVGVRSKRRETDRIWIVAESRLSADAHPGLVARIRAALEVDGVLADEVQIVEAGRLPRTTSGKPQRQRVADRIATGRAPVE